jgi:hypothetical protein
MLTLWIRDALDNGRLTLDDIKSLTDQDPKKLLEQVEPLPINKFRKLKNEAFIEVTKRDAVIDANEEVDNYVDDENPYGFIRYFSESSDEITFLIPSKNDDVICSSENDDIIPIESLNYSTIQNQAVVDDAESDFEHLSDFDLMPELETDFAIGGSYKKLPKLPMNELKTTSLTQLENLEIFEFWRQKSCPPNLKNYTDSLPFIDKTPSENSLLLPFCPPIQVDFEDFPNDLAILVTADDLREEKHKSELVILPVINEEWPIRTSNLNYVSNQELFLKNDDNQKPVSKMKRKIRESKRKQQQNEEFHENFSCQANLSQNGYINSTQLVNRENFEGNEIFNEKFHFPEEIIPYYSTVKKFKKSQKHDTKIPQKEPQICQNEPQFQPFIEKNQEEIETEFFVNGQKIEFFSNQSENHQNYFYQEVRNNAHVLPDQQQQQQINGLDKPYFRVQIVAQISPPRFHRNYEYNEEIIKNSQTPDLLKNLDTKSQWEATVHETS